MMRTQDELDGNIVRTLWEQQKSDNPTLTQKENNMTP
jgi:hypothetical protein